MFIKQIDENTSICFYYFDDRLFAALLLLENGKLILGECKKIAAFLDTSWSADCYRDGTFQVELIKLPREEYSYLHGKIIGNAIVME